MRPWKLPPYLSNFLRAFPSNELECKLPGSSCSSVTEKEKMPWGPSIWSAKLISFKSGDAVSDAVIIWFDKNVRNDLVISISDARPNVNSLKLFTRRNTGHIFLFGKEGRYMHAALINAIRAYCRTCETVVAEGNILFTRWSRRRPCYEMWKCSASKNVPWLAKSRGYFY